jgi:HEAT repeat protein
MRCSCLLAVLFCFAILVPARSQPPPKRKAKKVGEDLPDVSLQIPEDTQPEVKAIIKAQVLGLSSSKASERAKAAQILGELGEKGKPVRKLLCKALLDPSNSVRVAAADALKNIDPKIQYLAVKYVTEGGVLRELQNLKEDAEPLTPLVVHSAKLSAMGGSRPPSRRGGSLIDPRVRLGDEIVTLSFIAKNDPAVCKLIASALDNQDASVRYAAVQSLTRMKHGRQYVPRMLRLLKTESPHGLIAVIEALVALADMSNEEAIVEAISNHRYHEMESVRKAVEVALNKLESKQNP